MTTKMNQFEFAIDIDAFVRRSFRSCLLSIFFLVLSGIAHFTGWLGLPAWLTLGIFILLGAYILFELLSFPATYRKVKCMRLLVTNDVIKTIYGETSGEMYFSDLKCIKVNEKNERILSIGLVTKHNKQIELAQYNEMRSLLDLLQRRLAESRGKKL